VAFVKAMNLLHPRAMLMVWYHCIAMAIKMAIKVGTYYIFVLFAVSLMATGAIRSK
jgi:hypothetical protein